MTQYTGIIATVGTVEPIKGADRIRRADVTIADTVIGSAVVGTDVESMPKGTLFVFFPTDVQLSARYCEVNNLIARYDEQGNKIAGSGYLDGDKRRITTQKFKGVRSEGLLMPLSSLDYLGVRVDWKEGDSVGELGGEIVAQRYPKRIHNSYGGFSTPKVRTSSVDTFPLHYDTDNLLHVLSDLKEIPVGTPYIITEKLHGTSHRVTRAFVTRKVPVKMSFLQRAKAALFRIFGRTPEATMKEVITEEIVHGSRTVDLTDPTTPGYYGSNQFRFDTVGTPDLDLHETVYGEIVGYVGSTPIMPKHDLSKVDKNLGVFAYAYGCKEGESVFHVYRVARSVEVAPNVFVQKDLPWDLVKERAQALGYGTVPELHRGVWDGSVQNLAATVRKFAEALPEGYSLSALDTHPAEGVCIRFEFGDGLHKTYKYKSYAFRAGEGLNVAKNISDIEEGS